MKQLICISLGVDVGAGLREVLKDWDICHVIGLAEAGEALRADHFVVGMLLADAQFAALHELNLFLREHWWLKWVAVSRPELMTWPSYRQLVYDHCFDYHTWPLDEMRLRHTLGHALGIATLKPGITQMRSVCSQALTGKSEAVGQLRQQIAKVSAAEAPVLIWGESGTGKELVARAVHDGSQRSSGPFIPINCGGMPTTLIQSELFGHVKGAFTGAARDKAGLLEVAAGGTVFLDEIGDLPMEQQANLLRFLQEKTVCRVGGTTQRSVDVRVIAASHVRLSNAVALGTFREDLYYRLAVLTLDLPSLRERGHDVAELADHYFTYFANERAPQLRGFTREAYDALLSYHWPGNVRELVNRVRRALVMAESTLIEPSDLGLTRVMARTVDTVLKDVRVQAEREAIELRVRAGKSVARVAKELGISRMTLYRLMAKHGIARPTGRNGVRM